MQKQILVIEDDEILNAGLCYNLQKRDMLPFSAGSIEEAKKLMKQETFDLILLDINLPDGSGFDFAKETVAHQNIPFLFLTAHNLEEEMIQGLRTGADDYITKPFSIRVLMEKIQAVLRRCGGTQKPQPNDSVNMHIDYENRLVKKKCSTVALTPTEFEILETLCRSRGQILTKDVLLEKIWDRKENYVSEHTLSLNISRLRSKIADGEYEYIRTVYGLGYQWTGGQK